MLIEKTNPADYPVGATFGLTEIPANVMATGCKKTDSPYIPAANDAYVFRKDILREILNFLLEPSGDGFYLAGPTGSGKTTAITEILSRLNWPLQQITAHGRLEACDLIGQYKLMSTKPGQAPEMRWQYGVLATAMKYGHVLLINEIDYCDPAEISGLNDVIEGRPLVVSETGEIIYPHPMFRLFATGNSTGNGDDSGNYQGVQAQNSAFMDRFQVSNVWYMEPEIESVAVKKAAADLPDDFVQKMVEAANAVRKQHLGKSGDGSDGTIQATISTRTLIRWARLTVSNKQVDNAIKYALGLALTNRVDKTEKVAIEKIVDSLFGGQAA